jgi:thioredoxin-like negative regulator of GroEL
MKPLVEGLEKQYEGKVEFRRLNVDGSDANASGVADKLGVQYVPDFVFADSNGVIAQQLVGEQSEQTLRTGLDALK